MASLLAGSQSAQRSSDESRQEAHEQDMETLIGQSEEDNFSKMDLLPLIQAIHEDIVQTIDVSMTSEQLRKSELYFRLMRPLLRKYGEGLVPIKGVSLQDEPDSWRTGDLPKNWISCKALPYAFLINRMNFQMESEDDVARGPVLDTRAAFAETLAIKILRYFDLERDLPLALTTQLSPYNAESDVSNGASVADLPSDLSVLELAIVTSAKPFIASSLVQSVLDRLWNGNIILYPKTRKAILHDTYKSKPAVVFRSRFTKALPLLDLTKFQIPRFRYLVEVIKMLLLLTIFLLNLWLHSISTITAVEVLFILAATSFIQDELLQLHDAGASMYMANQSNTLDLGIAAIFLVYIITRIISFFILGSFDDDHREFGLYLGKLAFDILSTSSVLLFPRAAILYLRKNVLLIAIKTMISDFCLFIGFAGVMAIGFVICFLLLARGHQDDVGGYEHVLSICLQVFLGSSYLGWTVASSLNSILGPPLMLAYAIFCQFFLITTLISVLSNTFAKVISHSTQELLFSQAIRVFENLQTDPLMLYQAPFNLIVLPFLLPLRALLTERAFHRVNNFLTRLTNFPLLLLMWIWEHYEHATTVSHSGARLRNSGTRYSKTLKREITLPAIVFPEGKIGMGPSTIESATSKEPIISKIDAGLSDPTPVQSRADQTPKATQTAGYSMLNPFRVLSRDSSTVTTSTPALVPQTRLESMEAKLERLEGMMQRLLRSNLPNPSD